MRNRKLDASEIMAALQALRAGEAVSEVSQRWGISAATIYQLKKDYAGSGVHMLKRVETLARENAQLRQRVKSLERDSEVLCAALQAQRLSTRKRRELIDDLRQHFTVSLARMCRLIGMSRTLYHYESSEWNRESQDDPPGRQP